MIRTIQGHEIPLQMFVGIYDPCKFVKISNYAGRKKPRGGLWTSTFNENIGSGWLEFCKYEATSFVTSSKVTLVRARTNSRFVLIDSYQDLHSIMKMFEIDNERLKLFNNTNIDFEKMSRIVDGIYMTEDGVRSTSSNADIFVDSEKAGISYDLDSWDVESTLFFNTKAFDVVGIIKLKEKWV